MALRGSITPTMATSLPSISRTDGPSAASRSAARGAGIAIAVNRHAACRCALVNEPVSPALSREHNDANVIALGARLVGLDTAKACVTAFLEAEFVSGRHGPRFRKLGAPPVSAALP